MYQCRSFSFGALGGMATGGILGIFTGATAVALGYEVFMEVGHQLGL